jgi:hypothetical protein
MKLWPIGNLVPKNQKYWNKLRPKDKLVPKTPKYLNDATKLVNLR